MNMLDIGAEIIYSCCRGLTHKSVRVMHIPKCSHLAAVYCIKYLLEPCCIRIYTVSLNKKRDIVFLRYRNQKLHRINYNAVVDITCRSRITIAKHADKSGAELRSEFGISCYFSYCFISGIYIIDRFSGRKTWNLKL